MVKRICCERCYRLIFSTLCELTPPAAGMQHPAWHPSPPLAAYSHLLLCCLRTTPTSPCTIVKPDSSELHHGALLGLCAAQPLCSAPPDPASQKKSQIRLQLLGTMYSLVVA